jgi:hypothetical protein
LGSNDFTLLSAQDFSGWELNEMNQLNLDQLRRTNPPHLPN